MIWKNFEAHLEDNIGHRETSPFVMKVCFDEDIPRGEHIKFSTRTYVADDDRKMLPISVFYVKYPIDELVLELTVPIGLIYKPRLKCYKDSAREVQLWSSKNAIVSEIENFKKYSFSISPLQPWQYYALEWNFSERY